MRLARCAASTVRRSPESGGVHHRIPMPAMIAFTSAKSRLMMPGMVMMSEMPCTPGGDIVGDAKDSKEARVLRDGKQLFIRDQMGFAAP